MKSKLRVPHRSAAVWIVLFSLGLLVLPAIAQKDDPPPIELPACTAGTVTTYPAGFAAEDFDLAGIGVDADRHLYLDTGDQAINPESIVIPFEQDVWVSFLYEDAGYRSTLGWMLRTDAVFDRWGNFSWAGVPSSKKRTIFERIDDCCGGGDGILETASGKTESALKTFNDGTGLLYQVDDDGAVTPRDMRKHLGRFAAGAEIVFYLGADQSATSTDASRFFFTKTDWNPDTFTSCSRTSRTYQLGQSSGGNCETDSKGLLDQGARDRLNNSFGLTLSGTRTHTVTRNTRFPHVIAAAPDQDPNQWILSWEDVFGGGDMDYNDTTFRIERKTGGTARLKDSRAITPAEPDAYFTAVTFEIYDSMPAGECAGKTSIRYFLSIDNGATWTEINRWDAVRSFSIDNTGKKIVGAAASNWTPGSPALTYRTARVDFAALGSSGRQLLWKAEMTSEKETCVPKTMEARLTGSVATHSFISRAAPVMVGNILYAGSYETPLAGWADKRPRGHIQAVRVYDPKTNQFIEEEAKRLQWDGGTQVTAQAWDGRKIYFPQVTVTPVAGETLSLTRPDGSATNQGDGATTIFRGKLARAPLLATSVVISAGTRAFYDEQTDLLRSDWGHGTINRSTGEFTIAFNSPPSTSDIFRANYSWYTTASALEPFVSSNGKVSDTLLALDSSHVHGAGYTYDFNKDGAFTSADRVWLINWTRGAGREWKLGAIDHSVPAVLTAPGIPGWYRGSAISKDDRNSFDQFRKAHKTRRAVLFVGARDGMLHAFDAGAFRWDESSPKANSNFKYRGYFDREDYGTGHELWAFIPANLLPRLKNNVLRGDDQAYVDASPSIADVKIGETWRSVVIAAEGNGGDSVFCLDVTNPADPAFLWEYSDPDLFRSRSSPAIGQIGLIVDKGVPRWAAFFVSGKTDATRYPSVYLIDIADGSLISRIFLDADSGGKGGVPSGQPAIVDSDNNGYIDRLYVGTDKGRMYKVNLPDSPYSALHPISNCVVNTDFTDEDAGKDSSGNPVSATVPESQRWHPIYASPVVMLDDSGAARLFFGTGDSPYFDEDINTDNTAFHFFAYSDKSAKGSCGVESDVTLDWFYTLPAGHRIFASAFAAAGKVYFGTATSGTENPCDGPNKGKLFVFDINSKDSKPEFETTVGDVVAPPLVNDEHLFVNRQMMGRGTFNNPTKDLGGHSAVKAWYEKRK